MIFYNYDSPYMQHKEYTIYESDSVAKNILKDLF